MEITKYYTVKQSTQESLKFKLIKSVCHRITLDSTKFTPINNKRLLMEIQTKWVFTKKKKCEVYNGRYVSGCFGIIQTVTFLIQRLLM